MNDAEIRLKVVINSDEATGKINDIKIAAGNLNDKIEETEKTGEKTTKKLSVNFDNLAKSFTKAGKSLTVGLTLPIAGLITAGVAYNSKVETLTASFKVMTGSAEEAVDIVSQLKEIGAKTPYEFTGLAETVQLLMQYGQTSKQAIAVTKMVGDVSQGSAEKMNSIALAYGQMSSAGKVNLMDIKQMITAGFNPLQIISDKTGESMASMYDRISNGTMSVQEITQAFTYATSEGGKFYGSSEEQSKTLAGRLSTLKDNFNEATGSLTESLVPALESLVSKLTGAASWFASLDENQRKTILTILGIVAALGPALLAFSQLITIIKGVSAALTFLGANPIVLVISAIVVALILLITHFNTVKLVALTAFKAIGNAFIAMANLVIKGLNALVKGFLSPFNLIIKGLNKIPGVNIPALKLAIPKIPALNVGTNFVAQEGLAYLHQGEAVVPKKYNPAIGGGNGGYANIKIEMGDINMDGNKVGRAVIPYVTKTVKLSGGNV